MSDTKKIISMKLNDAIFEPRKDLSHDIQGLTNITINNGITSPFQSNSRIVLSKNTVNNNFEFDLRVKTPNFKTASDRIWIIRENTTTDTSKLSILWQPINNNNRGLYYGYYNNSDHQFLHLLSDGLDTLNENWYHVKFSKIGNTIKSTIYLDDGTVINQGSTTTDYAINVTNWGIFSFPNSTNYLAENAQIDLKNSYFTVF